MHNQFICIFNYFHANEKKYCDILVTLKEKYYAMNNI